MRLTTPTLVKQCSQYNVTFPWTSRIGLVIMVVLAYMVEVGRRIGASRRSTSRYRSDSPSIFSSICLFSKRLRKSKHSMVFLSVDYLGMGCSYATYPPSTCQRLEARTISLMSVRNFQGIVVLLVHPLAPAIDQPIMEDILKSNRDHVRPRVTKITRRRHVDQGTSIRRRFASHTAEILHLPPTDTPSALCFICYQSIVDKLQVRQAAAYQQLQE